jgi:hypothetical protein
VVSGAQLPPFAELDAWLCSNEHQVTALWLRGEQAFCRDAPCQISAQRL